MFPNFEFDTDKSAYPDGDKPVQIWKSQWPPKNPEVQPLSNSMSGGVGGSSKSAKENADGATIVRLDGQDELKK